MGVQITALQLPPMAIGLIWMGDSFTFFKISAIWQEERYEFSCAGGNSPGETATQHKMLGKLFYQLLQLSQLKCKSLLYPDN